MITNEKLPMIALADWVPGPRQGQWTYADYAALKDGQRYEIINGVLLMPPAPSWSHQEIVGEIFAYLRDHVRTAGLGGVFMSPIDVELWPRAVFQPDVVVLLKANGEKLRDGHIVGAPDLVIEVASPSTELFERVSKSDIYARAGVPEYWIVNPDKGAVDILVLEAGEYHSLGIFRGQETPPSRILSRLRVQVEQFFASAW